MQINKSEDLSKKILLLRSTQIILDRDLAKLYGVKATRLREQMKRNIERFPSDFMFQITEKEASDLVSQNAIPSRSYLGGHLPYAFTQEGVAMLSSILTSKQAIEVNIQIMRAFVNLKDLIAKEFYYNKKIETLEEKQLENTKNIDKIWEVIEPKTSGIFYDGQTYDAYDFIRKLITEAKERIILIDNYIDTSVITLLTNKKPNIQISIYTRDISEKIKLSIKKANEQYPYFEIKELANCHDRFLIIDNIDIYHIGASLKDLGKKWFAFSKLKKTDIDILDHIKQNL